jgi:hypothetical protein
MVQCIAAAFAPAPGILADRRCPRQQFLIVPDQDVERVFRLGAHVHSSIPISKGRHEHLLQFPGGGFMKSGCQCLSRVIFRKAVATGVVVAVLTMTSIGAVLPAVFAG